MLKQVLIVKCEQRGLTVIELMIALSILLIVLALGFNFYFYGAQAFSTGEQRTIVQNNVRLASVVITEELRFADQVEIYDEIPPHQEGKRTIYLNEEDGQVIIRDEEGNEQPASGQFSSEVVFTDLSFSVSTELNRILFFSIAAEREGEQEYQLESEVAPLNQKLGIVDNANGSTGIAVIYTVMNIGNIPRLSILPILIAPGENVDRVFELSLVNDKFVDLTTADIVLSGEAFSDLSNSDIEIMSYSDATAEITITGKFNEGLGSVTVLAAALEGNYDLTADVAVIPDYLFIVDDFIDDGIVGIAYTYTLTVTGGTEPYQFILADNEDGDATVLPAGLILNPNTGIVSGTPVEVVTDHEVFIGVSDAEGGEHVREYSITIENRQYNLSIASVGAGETVPGSPGNYLYDYGAVVSIEAFPDPGAEFTSWDGDVVEPGAAETTVTITGDMTVIANFRRLRVPLNEIEGGYYLTDMGGNIYIKLTGNSYMVLHHHAGNAPGKYGDFAATKMPSKSDLEGGVWNDGTRKEPGNKPYWTNTRSGSGANNFFTVNASGILEAKDRNTAGIYLREVTTFPGYLVEEKSGTLADPHILVDPGTP